MATDALELAWAAGFFDGEGSTFSGSYSNCTTLRLTVTQKSTPLLERFRVAVGGGRIYLKKDTNVHQYVVSGLANIQHVLSLLWPYLGDVKKQQAVQAVTAWAAFPREKFKTSLITLEGGVS